MSDKLSKWDRLLEKSEPGYPWHLVRDPPLTTLQKELKLFWATYAVVTVLGDALVTVYETE